MENSKLIKILINSGAIGIALATLFVLYRILDNHLPHIDTAIRENAQIQATVQRETNEVLRQNTKAIEGNVKILEIIERRIR